MGRQGGLLRGTPGGGVLRWSSCRAGMAMGMAGPDIAWRRRVALKRIGEDVHEPRTRGVPVGSGDHVKCNANRSSRSALPVAAMGRGLQLPGRASTNSALAYAFEIELDTCWKCLAMPSNVQNQILSCDANHGARPRRSEHAGDGRAERLGRAPAHGWGRVRRRVQPSASVHRLDGRMA